MYQYELHGFAASLYIHLPGSQLLRISVIIILNIFNHFLEKEWDFPNTPFYNLYHKMLYRAQRGQMFNCLRTPKNTHKNLCMMVCIHILSAGHMEKCKVLNLHSHPDYPNQWFQVQIQYGALLRISMQGCYGHMHLPTCV